ncbi:hypothetical protein N7522_007182 [Penicillium canescens]|uniref:Uncharacterized protein n=1 Tax=Penicillium canescens TaxID=5083 RepID=A0AAD6I8E5_PENCN|nr:hypothetical protein N7522_007182 [Penicillium canescens]KAJ6034961.1 hypothetical protein N7460_009136 [Penicillium canescens]
MYTYHYYKTLAAWLRPEVHPSILLGYNRQRLTASGFDLLSGNYGACGFPLETVSPNNPQTPNSLFKVAPIRS